MLALEVEQLGVIPIPFLVDTGAPLGVYLGTKAQEILRELNVMQEVIGREYPYILTQATLCHGDQRMTPVVAYPVPHPHESEAQGTLGNSCCDILGLQVICQF